MWELINERLFVELIGILGFVVLGVGLFNKDDQKTKAFIVIACFINGAYFLFLGLYISAFMMVFTAFRVTISMYTRSKIIGFLFIIISASTPFWLPSVDWVSAITGVTGTFAIFWCRLHWMRFFILMTTIVWMVNNFIYGAWVAFMGECFVFVIGSIRFYLMLTESRYRLNKEIEKSFF